MILSHRHRFIFFCNGKTGTSSIEKSLEHLDEGRRYAFRAPGLFIEKHIPPALLKAVLPRAQWESYFKFVFVRNPFDWFVSQWAWNFRLKFQGLPEAHPARRAVERRGDQAASGPAILGRSLSELAAVEVFGPADVEFLHEFLRRNHRALPQAGGCHQASYALDADGRTVVDFVGRYERLAEDYGQILARLGLALGLPHLKRAERRDYRACFTPDSATRVAELWSVDFKTFDYPTRLQA